MKRTSPILLLLATAALAQVTDQPFVRPLESFGDISTPAGAQAALDKGLAELTAGGGGVIVIPPGAPKELLVRNCTQTSVRGPAVTVMDYRQGFLTYHVPQIGKEQTGLWSGLRNERILNLSPDGLPHWGSYANEGIQNYIISGATSYMMPLLEPVTAGQDRRCYTDTIRGVYVGMRLTVSSSAMGYAPPFDYTQVKSLGWDPERRCNYFTADFKHDHPVGSLAYNKHNVKGLQVEGYSNCDNQSMELQVVREHYAVGDDFVISGTLKYMGDIFSGFGDEGGIVLNAETIGVLNFFRSTVEAVDWSADELTYAPGLVHAHTLANSRPLINMNEQKWLTAGKVRIVLPTGTYRGKTYPGHIGGLANVYNYQGGLIEGDADCPWTEDVIGRFFCVTDPSEVITPDDQSFAGGYAQRPDRPVYRWYQINGFERRDDGTKVIKILRCRWSAPPCGSPKLFRDDNYTADGHEVPLAYAIAPGAWVNDISRGWADVNQTGGRVYPTNPCPRKLKLTPTGDRGTRFDFAVGDPVEQPVGPDPWQPRPLRIRQFDQLPTTMDNATIEVQQLGRVQVPTAISLTSPHRGMDQLSRRKDARPPWSTMIELGSVCDVGINFAGDVTDTAIMFRQPNGRTQPIRWRNDVVGSSSLVVEPATGEFVLRGGDVNVTGKALKSVRGVSATDTAAANLRGIDRPVPAGGTELTVKFSLPEADAAYAVSVTPSWLTALCVPEKTAQGFTIQFATPAPAGATLDWILVR